MQSPESPLEQVTGGGAEPRASLAAKRESKTSAATSSGSGRSRRCLSSNWQLKLPLPMAVTRRNA